MILIDSDVVIGLTVKSVKTVSQRPQTLEVPTGFSDYKEVGGIKFPHTISQSFGPQTIEFKVQEIKINDGVNAADFEE